ncbi:hypothetical protein BDC45DRAFT_493417 [Circinella umbellata]|nr:hypothetical protein BDC45DRAFT_493417 [Circinella umbellata]
MISLTTFLTIYLLGGVTFLPVLLLVIFYLYSIDPQEALQSTTNKNNKSIYPKEEYKDCDYEQGKTGWIRFTNQHDATINSGRLMTTPGPNAHHHHGNNSSSNGIYSNSSSSSSSSISTSNNGSSSKKFKDLCYGVLKHGTLFIYESDKMLECKMIIPVHDFTISIYPEGRRDHELFSKSTAIRLRPKHLRKTAKKLNRNNHNVIKSKTDTNLLLDNNSSDDDTSKKDSWTLDQDFYLYCGQSIDKEDWYFALISGSNFMADSPTTNSKQFDPEAMQDLIKSIHHDPSTRQMQWLNAIMGRIFLGMYKTDKVHKFFEQKITKKVSKMKRPVFIDAIAVHRVQVGHAVPYLNNPKLLSLSMDGSLTAEAQIEYEGGLCVEIETGFLWTYSTRMKPIRVNLILSVTLKKLSGRFMFKIKQAPTNRYWIGFYEPPVMDLVIKPIVSDKQIKLNVVTNAIESKIRELIADTMVLPNMDDFIFCDSDGKGGIFDDEVPTPPMSTTPETPIQSTPSAPGSIKSEPGIMNQQRTQHSDDSKSTVSTSSRRSSSASLSPTPRTSESMPPVVRRTDSAKSPEHLSVQSNHEISKSSPDLLSGVQTDSVNKQSIERGGGETASLISQDSSDSNSSSTPTSSIRWPSSMNLRRKKKTSSDTASIISTTGKIDDDSDSIYHHDEEHVSSSAQSVRSVGSTRRGFLSKLKSEITEEMRSGERKPLYQKAEHIWQRSKEVTREYQKQQQDEREQAEREESASVEQEDQQLHYQEEQEQPRKEVIIMDSNGTNISKQEQQENEKAVPVEENLSRISKKPPAPPRPARRRPSSTKEEDRPPLPPRSPIDNNNNDHNNDNINNNNNIEQSSISSSFEPPIITKLPPPPPPRKAPPTLPPREFPKSSEDSRVNSAIFTKEQ